MLTGVTPVANGGTARTVMTGTPIQVVNSAAVGGNTASSSTSFAASGYSLAITPAQASSKIFISFNGNGGSAASSGTAGDLNESGEGGGGGNNANQAYGASGGEGGQFGENANNGGAAQHGAGSGGGNGAAIRRTTGGSFQLSKASGAEVDGSTTATGVS